MSNWQIVGDSSISFANAAAGDVRYWWDPDNGYTKFTQVWKSDDITDSNRAVFETLTAGQRTAILNAHDDTRVPAAGGVIAKASLKRQLRQYEMELSGENDTGLWYNGNWNINSIDFFSSVIDPEEKNTLMNYFSDEGTTFLDYANAANLTGVAPIKDCQVCANNVGEADDNNEGNKEIFLSGDLRGSIPDEFHIAIVDIAERNVINTFLEEGMIINQYSDLSYDIKLVAGDLDYVNRTTEEILSNIPSEFSLGQNYPNPFNPITKMDYTLPKRSRVIISIYNVLGQEIVNLVNEEQDFGYHSITWNGTDQLGRQMASGVYFTRMVSETFSQTKKMLLLK